MAKSRALEKDGRRERIFGLGRGASVQSDLDRFIGSSRDSHGRKPGLKKMVLHLKNDEIVVLY